MAAFHVPPALRSETPTPSPSNHKGLCSRYALPPEILRMIFEPLRGGEQRKLEGASGLGLGLYTSQQIAVAHGGAIHVVSDPKEGTRFSVELPRSPLDGSAEIEVGFIADLQQVVSASDTAEHIPGALRTHGSYGYEVVVTNMFAQVTGGSLFLGDQAGQRDSEFNRTPRNDANVLAAHKVFDAMVSAPTSTETVAGVRSEVRRSPGGRIVCKHIPDQKPVIEESWTCEIPRLKTAYVTAAASWSDGRDAP